MGIRELAKIKNGQDEARKSWITQITLVERFIGRNGLILLSWKSFGSIKIFCRYLKRRTNSKFGRGIK